MLNQSIQAQFLVPMAVSLAFGVLFATLVTLLVVPAGYLVLDDIGSLFGSRRSPDVLPVEGDTLDRGALEDGAH